MRQLRRLAELSGCHFAATDGEIGKLEEVYFDDQSWQVRYFVVRTGNWLVGQEVLILPQMVSGVAGEKPTLKVNLTRQQLADCPPVESKRPVSRSYELDYFRYYGWTPYWTGDPLFPSAPLIPPEPSEEKEPVPEHPHLRSSDELSGYHLLGQEDETLGYLEDFILDEQGWAIPYLSIDTRHWLPGKKFLLSPAWVKGIDWTRRELRLSLPDDVVRNAPEYDPDRVISRDYELELYKHFGKVFEHH